jgi:hypothetical protein
VVHRQRVSHRRLRAGAPDQESAGIPVPRAGDRRSLSIRPLATPFSHGHAGQWVDMSVRGGTLGANEGSLPFTAGRS